MSARNSITIRPVLFPSISMSKYTFGLLELGDAVLAAAPSSFDCRQPMFSLRISSLKRSDVSLSLSLCLSQPEAEKILCVDKYVRGITPEAE
mmetsp:Transcript_1984/g.3645  ORF Transcript_1984/g.3645 Transcript_1984/m.3645 type:complete len:92 (+) Transcript_1984:802-1077(+)